MLFFFTWAFSCGAVPGPEPQPLAWVSAIFRRGVGAGPVLELDGASAGDGAQAPGAPETPATVNWNQIIHFIFIWYAHS